jgi:UDP-N-acetylmuramate dehydrogenase
MLDEYNFSLLNYNTFGIDARCHHFMEYSSVEEAQEITILLNQEDMPLLILGGGSNLLLTGDYKGTVLHSAIKGIEVLREEGDDVLVRCGSGEIFDDVVAFCVEHQLYGSENLSIIPGEVGASAVQNIGAYGVEAKDIIDTIEAVEISTGEKWVINNEECCYSYRQSRFKHEWKDKFLITYVTYRLSRKFVPRLEYGNIRNQLDERGIATPTAQQLRDVIIGIRNAKLPDPKILGNAGSFFMNPIVDESKKKDLEGRFPNLRYFKVDGGYKIPAGWMIEQCGWKGKTLGAAGVYDKQALVLVNRGGATGEDVVRLMKKIQEDVKLKFDIEIYPEVNIR